MKQNIKVISWLLGCFLMAGIQGNNAAKAEEPVLITNIPANEYEVLRDFYESMEVKSVNWDFSQNDTNVTGWDGIATDGANIVKIALNGTNLGGEIPFSIGQLSALEELRLTDLSLKGTLPPEVGLLTNLAVLDLSDNQIAGNIPMEIENLVNLQTLNLTSCLFEELPAESILKLNLTNLLLGANRFSFKDLLPLKDAPFSNFVYAPQFPDHTPVGDHQDNVITTCGVGQGSLGTKLTIYVNFDLDIATNTYSWSKDDVVIPGATGPSLEVIVDEETHHYRFHVSNPALPDLTISSFLKQVDRGFTNYVGVHDLLFDAMDYDSDRILSVSAVTYADNWETDAIGIFRPAANFTYNSLRSGNRNIDEEVSLATDGTFEMSMFNWENGSTNQLLQDPNWVQGSLITRYNERGMELENRNAIGQYSAALYGYNGQVATAVGNNMRHQEVAFTGFEDDDDGNLTWNGGSNSKEVRIPVTNARGGWMILDFPYDRINELMLEPFVVRGQKLTKGVESVYTKTATVGCSGPYRRLSGPATPEDDQKSVIFIDGLDDSVSPADFWEGEAILMQTVNHNNDAKQVVDNKRYAHTGTKSLSVSGTKHYEQFKLQLEPNKKYVISAWVSKGQQTGVPNMGSNVGIKVGFGDNGTAEQQFFQPAGPVVEGWQRIEGEFAGTDLSKLHLFFESGSNATVYFDDLRIFPASGNMQSYVYDPDTYRLLATLDHNNFASLYYYDLEGNLYLVKKETVDGIKTIQESVTHTVTTDND